MKDIMNPAPSDRTADGLHAGSLVAQVITLEHRTDRQLLFAEHAKAQGIRYQWSAGQIHPTPATAVSRAHKIAVRYAQMTGQPYALVMEDDCWFPSSDGYRWWLANVPQRSFDLYLGGVYASSEGIRADGLITAFSGMHCYLVAARFYPTFLALPEDQHIDYALSKLGTYFVCQPFAAIQRPGYSDQRKEVADDAWRVAGKYRIDGLAGSPRGGPQMAQMTQMDTGAALLGSEPQRALRGAEKGTSPALRAPAPLPGSGESEHPQHQVG